MHLARSLPKSGWFGVRGLLAQACLGDATGDWSSYMDCFSGLVFTGVMSTSYGECVCIMVEMAVYIRSLSPWSCLAFGRQRMGPKLVSIDGRHPKIVDLRSGKVWSLQNGGMSDGCQR